MKILSFLKEKNFLLLPFKELTSSTDEADLYTLCEKFRLLLLLALFSPEGKRFNVSLLHLTVLQVV